MDPSKIEGIKRLLMEGARYREVAERYDLTPKQVRGINYYRFNVNVTKAFKERVYRAGIPSRLSVTDEFGYWFSGLFDGEGCLQFYFARAKEASKQVQAGATVVMRSDNNPALEYIRENLGVGGLYLNRSYPGSSRPNTRPRTWWQCYAIADLAEVVVPLFDKYPLRTKKRDEYPPWREAIMLIYANTIGGESNRSLRDGFADQEWQRLHDIAATLKRVRRWESD